MTSPIFLSISITGFISFKKTDRLKPNERTSRCEYLGSTSDLTPGILQAYDPRMPWLTISPNNVGFFKELIEEGDRLRDDVEFMTRLRQGGVTNTGVAGTGQ